MKHLKTASLTLVFTSLSSIVGVLAQTRSARPISALNLLRAREPKVVWNARSLLKADFDYDGIDDYALGGKTSLGYVVAVVKAPISAQSKHWTLRFSADPGDQDSLCSVSSAAIKLEPLNPDEVKGVSKLPKNSRGINLFDGACDSFHIYWDRKEKQFVWWRL